MGNYELVILFHPYKLGKIEDAINPYLELIRKSGSLQALESWGMRTLSYPIQKLLKAEYLFLQFSSTQDVLVDLSKSLRFDPLVLRYQPIKLRINHVYSPTELIDHDLTSKLQQHFNLTPITQDLETTTEESSNE